MGVLNVTPDSLLRRRALRRPRRRRRARRRACAGEGARPGRRRRRVDPPGRRPGRRRAPRSARVLPVDPRARRRRRADEHRHHPGRASPRPRSRPAPTVVNDVSGGLADPDMAAVVADAGCPWVLMHWRGHSRRMRGPGRATTTWSPRSATSCAQRVDEAVAAGVGAGPDHRRPGPRLRQAGRAQLARSPPTSTRSDRARLPGAVRGEPQVLPRRAAGRPGRQRRARSTSARRRRSPPACWRWPPAPGGCGCTTCAATVDALAVWRATGRPATCDDRRTR